MSLQQIVKTARSYRFYCNFSCQYFPCHKTDSPEFNCLFCYCPMYYLECLGSPSFINLPDGRRVKDCSGCDFPHRPENYDTIVEYLRIMAFGDIG
ncbi:MAG: metal-binding protein [Nitrospirae bacterium]|nr:metal-binding protein [Nitrospirota bacterium]